MVPLAGHADGSIEMAQDPQVFCSYLICLLYLDNIKFNTFIFPFFPKKNTEC